MYDGVVMSSRQVSSMAIENAVHIGQSITARRDGIPGKLIDTIAMTSRDINLCRRHDINIRIQFVASCFIVEL